MILSSSSTIDLDSLSVLSDLEKNSSGTQGTQRRVVCKKKNGELEIF